MKTHKFLTGLLSATLLMFAGLAQALDIQAYSSETLAELQAAGKPVAVHFHADWCSTCRAQERVFQDLRESGELEGITLLVANYDNERDLRKTMNVRSQSVVVVFRGTEETKRIGGQSRRDPIREALATAL